jgi:hypothetical protein
MRFILDCAILESFFFQQILLKNFQKTQFFNIFKENPYQTLKKLEITLFYTFLGGFRRFFTVFQQNLRILQHSFSTKSSDFSTTWQILSFFRVFWGDAPEKT